MMTRRQAIKTTALATAVAATAARTFSQDQPPPLVTGQPLITSSRDPYTSQQYPYALPPLPYPMDALEPHIDARTMEIHHDRHHKAYVDNLNKVVEEFPELGKKSFEDLLRNADSVPEKVRTVVRNQGGGHYNHSLFWQMMRKDGGGEPTADLAKAIDASFVSFSAFKEKFTEVATKAFGSGWAWLVIVPDRKLRIVTTPNQDTPLTLRDIAETLPDNLKSLPLPGIRVFSGQPVLGLDVWEHAYYLKYQNKRADYIAAWWNVVNWDFVAERYAKFAK